MTQLDKLGDKDFIGPTIIKQAQKSYDSRQRKENPNFTGIPSRFFHGQADLHTWNVLEYDCNAQSKVTFNDPQDTQTLYG